MTKNVPNGLQHENLVDDAELNLLSLLRKSLDPPDMYPKLCFLSLLCGSRLLGIFLYMCCESSSSNSFFGA